MKELTKKEEQILLSILHLKEKAYLVNIREKLKEITGKYLDVGTINKPLKKLAQDGYLDISFGDPTPVRGGKSIKYYCLTEKAFQALSETKSLNEKFWTNVIIPS
jgi:PadR family transcriptional regulator, regulatory protein PadR